MYCDFYQLRERPFNVTSDPKFLYLNACYREALASLHYGISQRRGFITLIGEAGTGKTTLLKKLLDDFDETTRTVFLFNTNVSFDEILEYIFHEFDLPVHNGKRLYMLQRLNSFLLDELRNGRNVALLIDEAQDLDYSVMEDLRLLSNLETAKEKIIQIVMSGQPELGQKLGNPGLRQLRQRVAINCRLQALSCDEVAEYIETRLVAAGSSEPKLFSRDAEARVYEISRGIPRLVNILCDNALVIGYALGKKRIGADVVTEAAADLFSPEPIAEETSGAAPIVPRVNEGWGSSQAAMVAIVALAILIGLFSVGRSFFSGDATLRRTTSVRRNLDVVPPALRQGASADLGARPVREAGAAPLGYREPARPAPTDLPAAGDPESVAVEHTTESARGGEPARVAVVAPAVLAADRLREDAVRPAAAQAPEAVVAEAPAPAAAEPPPRGEVAEDSSTPRDGGAELPEVIAPVSMPVSVAPPAVVGEAGVAEPERAVGWAPVLAAVRPETQSVPAALPVAGDAAVEPGAREAQPVKREAPVAVAVADGEYVVAQVGDSMSVIALRKYGLASHTILDLLKMANPEIRDIDVIAVGQKVRLPALEQGLALLREDDRGYALLLFSTPQQRRANEIEAALREKGFHAEVRRTDFGAGRAVYRLVVPNFTDREAAVAAGKQMQRLFREDDRLVAAVR